MLDDGHCTTSRSGRLSPRENNSQYQLSWVGPRAGHNVFLRIILPLLGIKLWIAQLIVSSLHRLRYTINCEPFINVSVHYTNQKLTKDVATNVNEAHKSKHVSQILVH
jgi:hypothetical protein